MWLLIQSFLFRNFLKHFQSGWRRVIKEDALASLDGFTSMLIGSSVAARWPKDLLPQTMLNVGLDGMKLSDLNNSRYSIASFENHIVIYCGSNDFLFDRDQHQMLIDIGNVFGCCKGRITYIGVMKSPWIGFFATVSQISHFNHQVNERLIARKDGSKVLYVDDCIDEDDFMMDGIHLKRSGYEKLTTKLLTEIGDAFA
jgi:hypothetical protein